MNRTLVILACSFAIALVLLPTRLVGQTIAESTVYSFSGPDGNDPIDLIQASDGNFYGIAILGGSSLGTGACFNGDDMGCGVIFKVSSSGKYSLLHSFTGVESGVYPRSIIQGSDGNFYGATILGGSSASSGGCTDGTVSLGCGTIFQITPSGSFKVLYSFTGGSDGASPTAVVQASDGNFYGTATYGGASVGSPACADIGGTGCGTIFKVTPSGAFSVLYSFTGGTDGAYPNALVQGSDQNFYGTTQSGGLGTACVGLGCGTVFSFSISGSFNTIYQFMGGSDGAETRTRIRRETITHQGAHVRVALPPSLVEGLDRNFYGTTPFDGFSNGGMLVTFFGTIFKVAPSGAFNTLYTFMGGADGSGCLTSLFLASDGNFYGPSGNAIFQITPTGSFSDPISFTGVIPEVKRKLGIHHLARSTAAEVSPRNNVASADDGAMPNVLVQGNDGNLYGGTEYGGNVNDCDDEGCGTIFQAAFSPALSAPVQLSLSPVTVPLNSSTTLSWAVSNGFSATLQQCYGFVQQGLSGAGNWKGLQSGSITNGQYSGSAVLTPTQAGTYTYALTCGGIESGFATVTVVSPSVTANPNTVTISAPGGTGTTTLTLTNFPNSTAAVSCSGLPGGACNLTNVMAASTTLQITTTAAMTSWINDPPNIAGSHVSITLTFIGLTAFAGIFGTRWGQRLPKQMKILFFLLVLSACVGVCACGGGMTHMETGGTPVGTYTVSVAVTAGTQSAVVPVTVIVQ